ncbi:MAG: biopolymer transporter ExbD [Myxococcales bacterium]|nr:biopolymer transporter ExbD [Myxococcales bacterium]
MAFSAGGNKGPRSDINVTPLIDVVLVLLIVFMVMVPKLLNQTQIDVPPKAPPTSMNEPPPSSDQLVATVAEDGRVAINGEAIPIDGLADKVRTLLQNRAKKIIFFNPDDAAPYGDVVKAMDICRGAGVKTLGIMTK